MKSVLPVAWKRWQPMTVAIPASEGRRRIMYYLLLTFLPSRPQAVAWLGKLARFGRGLSGSMSTARPGRKNPRFSEGPFETHFGTQASVLQNGPFWRKNALQRAALRIDG